jgi:hypothetical protein
MTRKGRQNGTLLCIGQSEKVKMLRGTVLKVALDGTSLVFQLADDRTPVPAVRQIYGGVLGARSP